MTRLESLTQRSLLLDVAGCCGSGAGYLRGGTFHAVGSRSERL